MRWAMETNLPDAYALLLVRLIALENRVDELREEVNELRVELHEASMK